MENRLILGDNLQILKTMPSESVDLCYIDPPFFSNRNYEVIWGDEGEIASFRDRWAGGIDHYIGWLKERIEEIWRVLKPTGSLYVHCDWHADAYIRVHILDRLQDARFINEIIWCYRGGGSSRNAFGRRHVLIFLYVKRGSHVFNGDAIRIPYEASGVNRKDSSMWGKHKGSNKVYKPNLLGKIPEDWWLMNILNANDSERIGYPTQKPLALMDRIIKASSNEGDVVLDAFCGGGTTLVAAQRLGRKFIGIDQSVRAIAVSRARLERESDLFSPPFTVEQHKYNRDSLLNMDAFKMVWCASSRRCHRICD
jgi:site-specific DNA-methyltransferase (adenine-specific)